MRDLVFRGATVVDGTGAARYLADVTVAEGVVIASDRRARTAPPRDRRPRRSTPTAWSSPPASSTCTPTPTCGSSSNPTTSPSHARASPARSSARTACPTPRSTTPRCPLLRRQIAGWNGDPDGFDLDLAHRRRVPGPARTRASPSTPATSCRTARSACSRWAGTTAAEPRRARPRCGNCVAQGMREGAVGMSSGLTYTPGMYAGTDELVELCEVVAALRRLLLPAPALLRRRRAGRLRRDDRDSRRSGCPLHLAHATMNFGVNAGPRRRVPGAGRRRLGERLRHHPRHLPLPARVHDAGRAAAQLVRRGRAGRDAGPAGRPGGPRADPRATSRNAAPTAATAWSSTGTPSRSAASRTPRWPVSSGGRSPSSRAARGVSGTDVVLRPAARRPARDHDPAARRPRGERPGDHAPPAAHGRQRRPAGRCAAASAGLGHVPALPRPLLPRPRAS